MPAPWKPRGAGFFARPTCGAGRRMLYCVRTKSQQGARGAAPAGRIGKQVQNLRGTAAVKGERPFACVTAMREDETAAATPEPEDLPCRAYRLVKGKRRLVDGPNTGRGHTNTPARPAVFFVPFSMRCGLRKAFIFAGKARFCHGTL